MQTELAGLTFPFTRSIGSRLKAKQGGFGSSGLRLCFAGPGAAAAHRGERQACELISISAGRESTSSARSCAGLNQHDEVLDNF
jgi:hypothetical protein